MVAVSLKKKLSNYVSEWSARYDVEAEFYCRAPRIDKLPVETRTTIYRVVQEALTNVAFFFQPEDGIRDADVTGVQTCALPISGQVAELKKERGGPVMVLGSSRLVPAL